MGVTASLTQVKSELFDIGMELFTQKGERAWFEFQDLEEKYTVRYAFLEKAWNTLHEIFIGTKWGTTPKWPIGKLLILGRSYAEYSASHYLLFGEVIQINEYLKDHDLANPQIFLTRAIEFVVTNDQAVRNEVQEKYINSSINWFEDTRELSINILSNKNYPPTEYERFIMGLRYHYEYYLVLEKFYNDCLKDKDTFVLQHIA